MCAEMKGDCEEMKDVFESRLSSIKLGNIDVSVKLHTLVILQRGEM